MRYLFVFLFVLIPSAVYAGDDAWLLTGGQTSQMDGHYEFCKTNGAECGPNDVADLGYVVLTDETKALIAKINDKVNAEVIQREDMDIFGKLEVWAYPNGVGDCEDIVLEKRIELWIEGLPLGALLITVVKQANGAGHAVLTVVTSEGDLVLDNLKPEVRPWYKTGYRFLKRQSEENSGYWVTLEDKRENPYEVYVASTN